MLTITLTPKTYSLPKQGGLGWVSRGTLVAPVTPLWRGCTAFIQRRCGTRAPLNANLFLYLGINAIHVASDGTETNLGFHLLAEEFAHQWLGATELG